MANFRPKKSLLSPKLPEGVYYEDTLENFLKPRKKKAKKKSADLQKKAFDNLEDFC